MKGFVFEYLPGKSATLALSTGQIPITFMFPTENFRDGSYQTAEPVLIKVQASEKNQIRVLTSQKVEIKFKGGEITEHKALEAKVLQTAPLDVGKETGFIRATISQTLPPGEYAVAFRQGDQLLQQVFDFRIAQ